MTLTKVSYSMIQGDVLNALDYGAVGDGSTNNTTALQNALDAAQDSHKALFIPAGTYNHTGLTFTKQVKIFGEGWSITSLSPLTFNGTVLVNTSGSNHSLAFNGSISTPAPQTLRITLRDFAMTSTAVAGTKDHINISYGSNFPEFSNLAVYNAPRRNISISGGINTAETGVNYPYIRDCWLEGAQAVTGVGGANLYVNGGPNGLTMIGGRCGGAVGAGIYLDNSTGEGSAGSFPNGCTFINVDVSGNLIGVLGIDGANNRFFGLRYEGNTSYDVQLGANCYNYQFYGNYYVSGRSGKVYDQSGQKSIFVGVNDGSFDYGNTGSAVATDGTFPAFFNRTSVTGAGAEQLLPKYYTVAIPVAAVGASGSTVSTIISALPHNATIKTISIIPKSTITGANTNYFKAAVRYYTSGVAQSLIGEFSFTSGNNASAFASSNLTLNSSYVNRDNGDVLVFENQGQGSGLSQPDLVVVIIYIPR